VSRRGFLKISVSSAFGLWMCIPSKTLAQTIFVFERVPAFFDSVWPPGFFVIRTKSDWSRFWARPLTAPLSPRPPPNVDFSQRMIIIVNLGLASGGYNLKITKYNPSVNALEYSVTPPAAGGSYPADNRRLVDIVLVPRSENPVTFYFTPFR
jgi:hypothetical protein